MRLLQLLLVSVGLLWVTVFATQNSSVVSLRFMVWQSVQLPLGLVVVMAASVGLFTAWLLAVLLKRK
ncbi:lipopolysaccharide assembly protein LapA domain-containing protein [Synechococcus sp. PCC 7336]|uniref:lipopolysaccharide assembly protein LapA domain-containing protein n=1 Tax=Synechococcus sp. PCC 7336 TaxID=195250 RepID=UPI0003492299|nr:lipopolysaccharide assembly protein LapA domain-containing protein [Synechococcus sp. PCC 7336]